MCNLVEYSFGKLIQSSHVCPSNWNAFVAGSTYNFLEALIPFLARQNKFLHDQLVGPTPTCAQCSPYCMHSKEQVVTLERNRATVTMRGV